MDEQKHNPGRQTKPNYLKFHREQTRMRKDTWEGVKAKDGRDILVQCCSFVGLPWLKTIHLASLLPMVADRPFILLEGN